MPEEIAQPQSRTTVRQQQHIQHQPQRCGETSEWNVRCGEWRAEASRAAREQNQSPARWRSGWQRPAHRPNRNHRRNLQVERSARKRRQAAATNNAPPERTDSVNAAAAVQVQTTRYANAQRTPHVANAQARRTRKYPTEARNVVAGVALQAVPLVPQQIRHTYCLVEHAARKERPRQTAM